jgi:autotransporter-associated beta strand protein
MKVWKVLVFLSNCGLALVMAGVPPSAAALYEAGNDYSLYGHLYQGDVPEIGSMACCPTAAINSFTYMQNQYPLIYDSRLASKPPTISDVQAIAGPSFMNTNTAGTSDPLVFWGRYLYLESRLPFQTQYSCQVAIRNGQPIHGDTDDVAWPMNRPLPKYLENAPGPISVPTWQFLYQNLQKGSDVGVGITFLNADGSASNSGHCLSLNNFSFDDKNNNGIIDKGEGKVSFVDPAENDQKEVSYNIWDNTDPGLLSGYSYLMLNYGQYGAILDSALAEYSKQQAIPDTVEAGNILLLTTNAPYGMLTWRGGVLYAIEPQTIWNKNMILGAEGGILENVSTCTLSGAISGTGILNKMGGGTLFLRGINSYSGGTKLLEGTVNIVRDENLGSPSGSLVFEGGTLQSGADITLARPIVCNPITGQQLLPVFNTFDTGVFAAICNGILTGDGNLLQKGQGALTWRGDGSAFRGNYTLASGTMIMEGTLGSGLSKCIVNNQGILKGSGILVMNVENEGIINPGNSVGTLKVVGGFDQFDNGRLEVEVASATSFDKLVMTGNFGVAHLNGALKPILLNGYRPPSNTVFPGVVTSGSLYSTTFATIENNTPILTWQALYSDTQVDLTLTRDYAKLSLGLTRNQQAVGAMFNGVADTTSGDLANVLNTLDNLTTGSAVGEAYKQISPDKVAALSTLAFAGANLQKGVLSQRITDLRFGSREAGVLGGLPGSFNLNYSRAAGLMLAYNSSDLSGMLTSEKKAGLAAPEKRWGLYLDPALVFGARQSSANQTGFDFTIAGFNAGADYRVRDDLLVGLASGYSHTGAAFHGSGGNVESNTWPLTAYAAYLPQSFYAYGSLGYALNLFDEERQISFGGLNRKAKSSPTGNQFNAYGEAGYDLKLSRLVVTPVVSLAYSSLWVDSFTESGAGALNLKVSPQQATSLQTGVGGKITLPQKRNSVVVVPQVYATYQHEYSDNSRGLDARLSQAGNTFSFQTDSPHRNFAVVGASINILTQKNFQVQLDYNAEVGRGNYTAHYVSAGLRWQL